MPCDPTQTCRICDQKGLPILPLRYAVARADVPAAERAPRLAAPFGASVQDITLPAAAAHYTLRLLRSGHLYVFNEVRGEWKAYVVTEDACLMEYPINSSPPDTGDAQPCARMQDSTAGRCIMVPDAAAAGALWLGFSDTAWTKAVLARHKNQAYRQRHMQRIDVGAWAAGAASQPHLQALTHLTRNVGEFHLPAPEPSHNTPEEVAQAEANGSILLAPVTVKGYPAYIHSMQGYANYQPAAEAILAAATLAANGLIPAMVALNDSVGITAEIAALASYRLERFMGDRQAARPLAVSTAIESVRQTIMEHAENRAIYRTEREARQALDVGYMGAGDGGGGARAGMALAEALSPSLRRQREEAFERWRHPDLQTVRAARNKAWEKYHVKYDEAQRASWQSAWRRRLAAFDRETILPLARAHTAWMRSGPLLEQFDCNHDQRDVRSGKGFVDALTLCIQDTQQYRPCFDLYCAWVSATEIGRDNLALRALGYDQTALLKGFAQASGGRVSGPSLRGVPWDGLISAYGEAEQALSQGGGNAVVRITAVLGGPITDLMSRAVDGVIGPGLVAAGVIAKSPVLLVDRVMTKAEAITELVGRMAAVNDKVTDLTSLNRAIDLHMRKAQIRGVRLQQSRQYRWLIMADKAVIEDFPGGNARGDARRLAAAAILTEDDRRRLTQVRWRRLLPTSAGLGVITALMQTAALAKLADDVDSNMAHETGEHAWRYGGGVAALAGTLAETVGKWSESASTAGSRLALRLEATLGTFLRAGGKALGIGAGVVMAVWDFRRGTEEVSEGNILVGLLYGGSAVASLFAAFAFSAWGAAIFGAAATGIGIILVIAVIVIAILIEVFKDDKIQDWLERCHFGKFKPGERYRDIDVEMKELQIALAG